MAAASMTRSSDIRLVLAIGITVTVLVAEVAGGLAANSLALLSDAGHVFTDLIALALAWIGVRQTRRRPTQRMTFGYHRAGIVLAVVNALMLLGMTAVIYYEAVQRLTSPSDVEGGLVLAVAGVGLVANGAVLFLLQPGGHAHLGVRSAALHVLGDLLGSVGVIVAAGIIVLTGWTLADPIASMIVGAIIAVGAWRIIREALDILLERAPESLDVAEVVRSISRVEGVRDVHDLHIWTIAPDLHALSCHLEVNDQSISDAAGVLACVNEVLATRFNIGHSTIQLEAPGCDPNELYCTLTPEGQERDAVAANPLAHHDGHRH